ncbi:MAG TPA: rhomboid family intramembrane serine protease [Rhizobiaceae bacterium]|nr:rhomboid family intramembrane serine protease [Rhizobiaceae bacterium]
MSETDPTDQEPWRGLAPPALREPALNLPVFVVLFAAFVIAVHAVRTLLLDRAQDLWVLIIFAFIPARYGMEAPAYPVPLAAIWTPVSYAFLHADWTHVIVNLLWLAAFGSPVAVRIGNVRIVILSLIAALAGAALHFAWYVGDTTPMIGASAIVSGHMGAAARFAFQPGRRRGLNIHGPALPLAKSLTDTRFLSFLAVWMGLNFVFGSGLVPIAGDGASIAWQAHVGGFVAGILAFSFLDKPSPQ